MYQKYFNMLEEEQKTIISSVYFDHLVSIGDLSTEYSVFMPDAENVYEKAKNTPHFAVDYLHSLSNEMLRRRMLHSYKSLLLSLIDALRVAGHKNIAMVFKRALVILQDDFSVELSLPIEESITSIEYKSDMEAEENEKPTNVIHLEEGQTEIEESAYYNRDDISTLFIPTSITNIHPKAFLNFYGTFVVNIANPKYSSSDGILYNKDKSLLLRVPIKIGFDAYTTAAIVKTIGKYAFQGSIHLLFVDIGNNVKRIEDFAFSENVDLEELHIASNVEYLGHLIFIGCTNLRLIYCDISEPNRLIMENDSFNGIDLSNITLIVPPSVLEKYKQHREWGKFTNIQANTNILEEKPETEETSYTPSYSYHGGGHCGWGTFHGYQNVSGHWRSGHWRNGHWVSGHYVRTHGRWR